VDLTHSFVVPVDRATAWATFEDIAGVAECFPGAVVTSVEGDTFEGTCKVKLGPIALQYGGTGSFVERDEAAGRFVLDAKGKDKRGNGTAGAHVTASFTEEGPSSTKVEVVTDLQITGKPAQFGRGVIQDVSDKLLGQFVDCLQARIGTGPDSEAGPADATPPAPTDATAEEPAAAAAVASATEPAATPPTPGAPSSRPTPVADPAAARTAPRTPPPKPKDDALDLGATVLPILARTYWKQAAGAALVLLVIWRLLRRRR
jgi:carbon monoxide dehydrogenase subunit G